MAGPSDIGSILSQSGRIEKINQTPFAHADVAKQVLSEQEARARILIARQVNESKRVQEANERKHKQERRAPRHQEEAPGSEAEAEGAVKEAKHLIDLVI